jgi:hypothetical protein
MTSSRFHDLTFLLAPAMSCFSYEDSVLSYADHLGNLSHGDAEKLLADHSFTLEDVYADNHGVSWCRLDERNAEALLAWLGY